MIEDVFDQLAKRLKAKGCPYEIHDGPGQVPLAVGATRIEWVFADGSDDWKPGGNSRNPPMVAILGISGRVRIFAHATTPKGARHRDHARLAIKIACFVRAELGLIARDLPTTIAFLRSGFVTDFKVPDGWAGVVYEIPFQIDHAVHLYANWLSVPAEEDEVTGATTLIASGSGASDLPSATTRVS